MKEISKECIEMMSQLPMDTLLNIKYENNGVVSWCKYFIPTVRKDGTPVLFGELYYYFTKKKGFKFGLGYYASEDPDGRHYIAHTQYFGFTLMQTPHWNIKQLEKALILPKYISRSKEK
jgi:hypothetical protein